MIQIALEDEADRKPITVGAKVLRQEGPAGVALQFEWIEHGSEGRLRALVEALPKIETLSGGSQTFSSFVMSTLLSAPKHIQHSSAFDRIKRAISGG